MGRIITETVKKISTWVSSIVYINYLIAEWYYNRNLFVYKWSVLVTIRDMSIGVASSGFKFNIANVLRYYLK